MYHKSGKYHLQPFEGLHNHEVRDLSDGPGYNLNRVRSASKVQVHPQAAGLDLLEGIYSESRSARDATCGTEYVMFYASVGRAIIRTGLDCTEPSGYHLVPKY